MRGRFLAILFSLFFCTSLLAQQSYVITLFDKNQPVYNPGAIGNQEVLTANFSYRQQWVGFPGVPSTQYFCAHAPLKNPNVALGVVLEHDASGDLNQTGVYFNYAYRLELGMNRLAFGLKAGLTNGSLNESVRVDPDPAFIDENFTLPNFGFGVCYYGRNYWAGFSVPRLFGFDTKGTEKYKMDFDFSNLEYFISGGGVFNVNADFSIDPSMYLVLSSTYDLSLTINTMATYKRSYSAGLGWRTGDNKSFIFMASYCLNRQFSIGYSYDAAIIGDISNHTSGTHEINIYYKFGYKVNADNPRDF